MMRPQHVLERFHVNQNSAGVCKTLLDFGFTILGL